MIVNVPARCADCNGRRARQTLDVTAASGEIARRSAPLFIEIHNLVIPGCAGIPGPPEPPKAVNAPDIRQKIIEAACGISQRFEEMSNLGLSARDWPRRRIVKLATRRPTRRACGPLKTLWNQATQAGLL